MYRLFYNTFIIISILLLKNVTTLANDSTRTGWKKSLIVDITTTQSGYSDSWVGGEAGSVNWVSNLNGFASKQLKDWFNYKITLKSSFGQTITQDIETKAWGKPKKSTDLIDFENVGQFTIGVFADPYIAFRIETQFYDGRYENKKLYFSPVKITESTGMTHNFYKEKDDFISSRLGLGLRQIIKTAIIDSVALTTDDSTLTDGGIESVTDFTLSFHKNLRYTGKLTLYRALFFSKSNEVKGTPYENDWKAVDINWENIISASITKIITVNLYTQFLYDKEVSRKGRFKETIAIGFVFKMI